MRLLLLHCNRTHCRHRICAHSLPTHPSSLPSDPSARLHAPHFPPYPTYLPVFTCLTFAFISEYLGITHTIPRPFAHSLPPQTDSLTASTPQIYLDRFEIRNPVKRYAHPLRSTPPFTALSQCRASSIGFLVAESRAEAHATQSRYPSHLPNGCSVSTWAVSLDGVVMSADT